MKNVKEITWEIFLPIETLCMSCKEKNATHIGKIEFGTVGTINLHVCGDCIELEDEDALQKARSKIIDKDFSISDIQDSRLELLNPDWNNTTDNEKTIIRKINQLCRVIIQMKRDIQLS